MKKSYPQPVIGACGWRHQRWRNAFYPEDLPDDWQLAYYANEFLTVLVPQTQWQQSSFDECQAWLEEVGADFRLFLHYQVADSASLELFEALMKQRHWPLAGLGGVVMDISNEEILYRLMTKQACFGCPVFVGYSGGALTDPALFNMVNFVWQPDQSSPLSTGMSTSVGRIRESDVADDRKLRAVIERYLHRGGAVAQESYLFFDGRPPNIDVMRKATVISQLL